MGHLKTYRENESFHTEKLLKLTTPELLEHVLLLEKLLSKVADKANFNQVDRDHFDGIYSILISKLWVKD